MLYLIFVIIGFAGGFCFGCWWSGHILGQALNLRPGKNFQAIREFLYECGWINLKPPK